MHLYNLFLQEKKKQEERAGEDTSTGQAASAPSDDKKKIMNAWIATAEKGLKQMVKFAKDLPGFNSLPLPDQIMLLKSEYFMEIQINMFLTISDGCVVTERG